MKIDKLVFSPIEVNTYIISEGSGDCAIIDCGCYSSEEREKLVSFLEKNDLNPVMLLNTHLHLDHLFGNGFLKQRYGLLTHASPHDEYNRASAVRHAIMFGLEMEEPPVIGTELSDRQRLTLGALSFETVFVPGHTTGSMAFYFPQEDCIFTGDALFAGSIGRTDLPGGDFNTLMESIRERLLTLPDDIVVYPGHGPATTIGEERRTNSFLI
ncbi:MAG: MBL fold metallo-hydrolase [Bacteroidales bacterium]|nr:MBL fold metallo-hydrolase [Bacteroidales bacterium]